MLDYLLCCKLYDTSSINLSISWKPRSAVYARGAHRCLILIRTNFHRNGTQLTSIWQRELVRNTTWLAFTAWKGGSELDERTAVSIVHLERLTNAAGNTFCQVEGKWRFIATRGRFPRLEIDQRSARWMGKVHRVNRASEYSISTLSLPIYIFTFLCCANV